MGHRSKMGETGLLATPIGLGLAALGRPGYINIGHHADIGDDKSVEAMEANAHKVLDAAWDGGVRYFDAARSYGNSELFLASWLSARDIKRSEVTIASKWGYVYNANWSVKAEQHEIKIHTIDNLNRQWQESRDILSGYLNLYQIHSATLESGVLENMDVLNRLTQLKDKGVKIGLSVSGPEQTKTITKAVDTVVDGRRLFDTIQATWNLLESSATKALTEAHENGTGIIIKEAVANGRLIQDDENSTVDLKTMHEVARRIGCTLDALALAVACNMPFADVILSGAGTVDQLNSNLSALDINLSQFVKDELNYLKQDALTYWQERSALQWN